MTPANTDAPLDAEQSEGCGPLALADPRVQSLVLPYGSPPVQGDEHPVERALYTPHPFALQEQQAEALCYEAIHASFAYHLQHNAFYRRYAAAAGVRAEDLRGPEHLVKIPLVPVHVFKSCPGPHEFLPWLTSLSASDIAWPAAAIPTSSYEEQIALLYRDCGIQVESMAGDNGAVLFLPFDRVSQRRNVHANILTFFAMYPEFRNITELTSVTLWPPTFRWPSWIVPQGRVRSLLDRSLDQAMLAELSAPQKLRRFVHRFFGRRQARQGIALLAGILARLKEVAATGMPGVLWIPSSLLGVLSRCALEQDGGLQLGNAWRVIHSGGWQPNLEQPISAAELRTLTAQGLGILPEQVYDLYSPIGSLGPCALSCEGGYLHISPPLVHPMVVSEAMEPLDEGMWGRFAFLSPLPQAFPGFIVTEDRVRLWRRCPSCDRRGPVLDPAISPMHDGGDRSCGNIVRQIIAERLTT